MDIKLLKEMREKIQVEIVGFAFFVDIEYEKVLEFCHFYKASGHSDVNYRRKPQLHNRDIGRRTEPMKTKVVYREKEHVHPTVVVNHDKGDQDRSLRGDTSGVNKGLEEKNVETTIIILEVVPFDKDLSLDSS